MFLGRRVPSPRKYPRGVATALLALGMALGATTGSGCGSDDVGPQSHMVGGRCAVNGDCVDRCVTGAEFPGGYCTVGCATDSDCPGGAACVASNGGVCLATCKITADCDGYGPRYQCGLQTRQSGGAAAMACAAAN